MADQPQAEPVGGVPMLLDPATAKRIEAAVAYVEGTYRNRSPGGLRGPRGGDISCEIAKATSSITARSTSTYGTGSAKIQSDSGTAFSDDGETVTVKNMTDKTIASGAYVLIVWALGKWWVAAVGSCDNLS
jgi:hypothetical protein